MGTDIEAILIHDPIDHWKSVLEVEHNEEKDTTKFNLKNRFLSARKMPAFLISKDKEGGYIVKSANKNRRMKSIIYHVYKTRFGTWICTCQDFLYLQKICKHIIRIILLLNRTPEDERDDNSRFDKLLDKILDSERYDYHSYYTRGEYLFEDDEKLYKS